METGAVSSASFFILSKIVGLAIRGETWIVLLLFFALVALLRGRTRRAAAWLSAGLAAVLALTLLPAGDWLMRPLEAQYPASPPLDATPDGIIVLGGAVEVGMWLETGQVHVNDSGERLTEAAILARRFPGARIVLTGGGVTLDEIAQGRSEAATMAAFLAAIGVDPARLVLEESSRNTTENATRSFALVQPQPGETWLLVTSASHMPRAMASFENAGWTGLTAWPVDFTVPRAGRGYNWDLPLNLYYLNRAVKEFVGVVGYRLFGRL